MKKKTLFKVNNQIVFEETRDLYLNEIDEKKWFVANQCSCHYDDVEVEVVDNHRELSEIDVTTGGMFSWSDVNMNFYTGLSLAFELGSDEHLNAINNNNLIDFIEFV